MLLFLEITYVPGGLLLAGYRDGLLSLDPDHGSQGLDLLGRIETLEPSLPEFLGRFRLSVELDRPLDSLLGRIRGQGAFWMDVEYELNLEYRAS